MIFLIFPPISVKNNLLKGNYRFNVYPANSMKYDLAKGQRVASTSLTLYQTNNFSTGPN